MATTWHTIIWTDTTGRPRLDKVRGKSDTDARVKLAQLDPEFAKIDRRSVSPATCDECRANEARGIGPSHRGSGCCRMRTSIASGGTRAHCSCSACW